LREPSARSSILAASWLAGWGVLAGWLSNDAPTIRNYYIEQFDVNPEAISLLPPWLQPRQSAGLDLQQAAVLQSEWITDQPA
jgi:hypothetical protein